MLLASMDVNNCYTQRGDSIVTSYYSRILLEQTKVVYIREIHSSI